MGKQLTTPQGKASWPSLREPDTRFDSDGFYSCKLHVSESDFDKFNAEVAPIVEAAYQAECKRQNVSELRMAPSNPIRVSDEGKFEIYAKQKARVHTRRSGTLEFEVAAIDVDGNECDMPDIGSGSTIKMAVEVSTWYMASQGFGCSLRLQAVQILELVSNSKGKSFGFKSESGLFSANWA